MRSTTRQETQIEQHRSSAHIECPHCKKDIAHFVLEQVALATGLKEKELRNGTLGNLPMVVRAGQMVFEQQGIKFKTESISEKTVEQVMETLVKPVLQKKEREELKKALDEQEEMTKQAEEKQRQAEKTADKEKTEKEKAQRELEDLKTKVYSNPALKGAAAQADLFEDLEANFHEQKFEDISKKGRGDILWATVRIETPTGTQETPITVVIDSKDKGKITSEDINKLRSDMKSRSSRVGIVIATKQEQLRQKETPCGVYNFGEGVVIVTSRENFSHHIAIRLVRDVLASRLSEETKPVNKVDVKKLAGVLSDIANTKEFFEKIRAKAGQIADLSDEGEAALKKKFDEASKLLAA